MAMWRFLLRACNTAAAPSLNLLGEIGLLSSLVSWSSCLMFVLVLLSFFLVLLTLFIYILIVSMALFILVFILVLYVMFVSFFCCSCIDFL